ncbi:MAG TPA: chromate transporter [Alphaproteobacteria bacterium]|nr:chromate transporter [Alphaproteobacteria bacterium]
MEPSTEHVDAGHKPVPSVGAIFLGFLHVGMLGFGGVLPMTRRMLVEDRRWVNPAEFVDLLAFCQFLPGGNIMNLSIAIGLRFRGPLGAIAAITGLFAAPALIVVTLGVIYERYAQEPRVAAVFAGLAAAAAGLVIGAALKIAAPLRRKPVSLLLAIACCVAIAVFRAPLSATVLVMAPLSILLTWQLES